MIATFWFRDDDACAVPPQFERQQELAVRYGVEIALAVIPGKLEIELIDRLRMEGSPFHAMCHGWKPVNYGPEGRREIWAGQGVSARMRSSPSTSSERISEAARW